MAAAKYLVEEGYARKEQLAIMGGSNGGLVRGIPPETFISEFRRM